MMKGLRVLLIVAVLVFCSEARDRSAKVSKRHARQRDFRAVGQASVVRTFTNPQQAQNVPVQYQPQPLQNQQTQYQSPTRNVPVQDQPQPQPQAQYQPKTQNVPVLNQLQPLQQQQTQYQPQALQQQQTQYQPQPLQQQQQTQYQPQAQNVPVQYQPQPQPLTPHQPQAQNVAVQYQPQTLSVYQPQPVSQGASVNRLSTFNEAYRTQNTPPAPIPHSQLIQTQVGSLVTKLVSNATLIRPNIVDGFSCIGRIYGFYADTLNECQIFHVCVPLRLVHNNNPTVPDITQQFSFICNEFTMFAQDTMTCAWKYEAVPCMYAEQLYSMNDIFFRTTLPPPTTVQSSVPRIGSGYVPLGSGPAPGLVPAPGLAPVPAPAYGAAPPPRTAAQLGSYRTP